MATSYQKSWLLLVRCCVVLFAACMLGMNIGRLGRAAWDQLQSVDVSEER